MYGVGEAVVHYGNLRLAKILSHSKLTHFIRQTNSDRHQNDVVYSICCNRQLKSVAVVFRGTVNSHNWIMNMKFAMAEHANPITDEYLGREDEFGLHTGFALYMMRRRKDVEMTKIEEILHRVEAIGRELSRDGDFSLTITGHSLGGALATILGFYAAASNSFARAVRVFTFAAPRVGEFLTNALFCILI